jgi:hypothetical protein
MINDLFVLEIEVIVLFDKEILNCSPLALLGLYLVQERIFDHHEHKKQLQKIDFVPSLDHLDRPYNDPSSQHNQVRSRGVLPLHPSYPKPDMKLSLHPATQCVNFLSLQTSYYHH